MEPTAREICRGLFIEAVLSLIKIVLSWAVGISMTVMVLYGKYFVLGAVLLVALTLWLWNRASQDRVDPDEDEQQHGMLADHQLAIPAAAAAVLFTMVAALVWCEPKCTKVDIMDPKLLEKKQLFELRYMTRDDTVWTLNLVKELADGDKWEKVALVIGENPQVIYRNYVSHKKQVEYCKDLVSKIISLGYNGKFGWSAYIKAFKRTAGLNNVVRKLEDMLTCLKIDLEASEEVGEQNFTRMSCKDDGTTLHLIEDIAPYWEEVARTFGIARHLISSDPNIAEQCSRVVLEKLVDQGYGGSLGWQGIIGAVEAADVDKKLVATLRTALECVVTD